MKTKSRACLLSTLAVLVVGGCPWGISPIVEGNERVRLTTTKGVIVIELFPEASPATVANFRAYVEESFYDGTIFHRVVPGFVIQAGGYTSGLTELTPGRAPIGNESLNGVPNVRGTVAMAYLTGQPDSATSQFFINVADNRALDATLDRFGYAVFGIVVEGMSVADEIAALETATVDGLSDVPVEEVVVTSAALEPGVLEFESEFEAYLDNLEYGSLNLVRDVAVDLLGWWMFQ